MENENIPFLNAVCCLFAVKGPFPPYWFSFLQALSLCYVPLFLKNLNISPCLALPVGHKPLYLVSEAVSSHSFVPQPCTGCRAPLSSATLLQGLPLWYDSYLYWPQWTEITFALLLTKIAVAMATCKDDCSFQDNLQDNDSSQFLF